MLNSAAGVSKPDNHGGESSRFLLLRYPVYWKSAGLSRRKSVFPRLSAIHLSSMNPVGEGFNSFAVTQKSFGVIEDIFAVVLTSFAALHNCFAAVKNESRAFQNSFGVSRKSFGAFKNGFGGVQKTVGGSPKLVGVARKSFGALRQSFGGSPHPVDIMLTLKLASYNNNLTIKGD
ncbi:MAG: hypothetical protein QG657_1772 [Acidobacteriota bacterium]|nr:hypothetical protein [Acidobacteriota bacterium]